MVRDFHRTAEKRKEKGKNRDYYELSTINGLEFEKGPVYYWMMTS
jgi:hypothetical protein